MLLLHALTSFLCANFASPDTMQLAACRAATMACSFDKMFSLHSALKTLCRAACCRDLDHFSIPVAWPRRKHYLGGPAWGKFTYWNNRHGHFFIKFICPKICCSVLHKRVCSNSWSLSLTPVRSWLKMKYCFFYKTLTTRRGEWFVQINPCEAHFSSALLWSNWKRSVTIKHLCKASIFQP